MPAVPDLVGRIVWPDRYLGDGGTPGKVEHSAVHPGQVIAAFTSDDQETEPVMSPRPIGPSVATGFFLIGLETPLRRSPSMKATDRSRLGRSPLAANRLADHAGTPR